MDPVVVWSRAVALAAVTMLAGVVGHVSADGLLPGAAGMAVLSMTTVVLSAALLQRPASRRRVVALLVGGQAVVHVALTVAAGHAGDAARTGHRAVGAGGLPTVDGQRVGSLIDSYQASVGASSSVAPALPVGHLVSDLAAHAPMMLAHLAAAVVVGLWLAAGEQALWALVALASCAALGPLAAAVGAGRAVVVPPVAVVPADPEPASPPSSLLLARVVVRRGPPALLAAA